MSELDRWQAYWSRQSVPGHREESEAHYRALAEELRLLLIGLPTNAVLEMGCGNGALYPHLGFDRAARYRGLDISTSMLEVFRARHPGADIAEGSAHTYRDEGGWDVIFSNGMVQYLDAGMFRAHLANAAAMLNKGGALVMGSVLWRCMRYDLTVGDMRREGLSLPVGLAKWLKRVLWRDSLGHWHSWHGVRAEARAAGLEASFYGSMLYPYRFHAVLRKP